MKILAVDPGNVKSAYVLLIDGEIKDKGICDNLNIGNVLCNLPKDTNIVIESITSYGMAVGKTVFETCIWIGRFYEQACFYAATTPRLVYRKDIKMHFCNSPRAKDSNIRQVMLDRYGEPGTKKAPGRTYGISKDMWSALAIGTYYEDTTKHVCNVRTLTDD
jgi:hypothetical protein